MSFDSIPGLLNDLIRAQQETRDAILSLAEAIADGRKAVVEKAKAKKAVETVVEKATEVAADATAYAEAKAITTEPGDYDAAKAAILDVSKKQGREAAMKVLGNFGVTKLPDLDPMHYAALTQAAIEALQE